jgi:hypothetical protein
VWLINLRPDLRTRYTDFRTQDSALCLSDNEEGLETELQLNRDEDLDDCAEQADEQADDDCEDATDEAEHERDQTREADAVVPSDTIGAVEFNNCTYSRAATMTILIETTSMPG